MVILLVDSDKAALDREAKRLAQRQSAVTASLHSNAADAIEFASHHEVDAVFTRAVLEEMSGEELIGKIRQFRPKVQGWILFQGEPIPLPPALEAGPDRAWESGERLKAGVRDGVGGQTDSGSALPAYTGRQERKKGDTIMAERGLRNLGRKELLELMIEQGKEMEDCRSKYEKDLAFLKSEYEKERQALKAEHEQETAALKAELQKAKEALQKREIVLDEAGSIAIAALQLNGVFEAAQAAGQQYIENIRSLSERQASICARREAENQAEIDRRLNEVAGKCAEMESACRQKCEDMENEAKRRSEAYWLEVSQRLQAFYENHQELKKLLNFSTPSFSA